jgi:poly(3-hydroxyalkanoate) synthetase
MSGDWQRLHRVRGVCNGSPKSDWVAWLSHKAKAEDSMWLSGQNRSNWLMKPARPVWGRRAPKRFEAEGTRRDRMVCVKATRGAFAGHASDGAMTRVSQSALRGRVS